MLRRSLLGFIGGTVGSLLATPVLARSFIKETECGDFTPCIERGNMVYTYNKIGIPVSYSKELAADLYSIHGMDAKKTLQNMYGTSFSITKKIVRYKTETWLKFTRITDDSRDRPYIWYQKI